MRRAGEILTEVRIAAVKAPATGTRDLHDAVEPGLIYRVRSNGWRGWALRYTAPSGKRRLAVLGTHGDAEGDLSLARARQIAHEARAGIRDGLDPLEARSEARRQAAERADAGKRAQQAARAAQRAEEERQRAIAAGKPIPGTFGHLANRYMVKHARATKRTWREDERMIRADLLPAWAQRPPGEITRADVRALVDAIAEGEPPRTRPAPIAANRVRALVSKIFAFGVDAEYPGVTVNPAYRLKPPSPEGSRDRVLSEGEIRALWLATESEAPMFRAAFRLLLLTGLRRGELLGTRWREIVEDELGAWLEIPAARMKGKRPLRAPLSALARETLADLEPIRDPEFVFPASVPGIPRYDLKDPLNRIRRKVAEIVGLGGDPRPWHVHDLRRTFRTMLAQLRVSHEIGERLIGHLTPGSTGVAEVYDRHTYAPERMAAVEALAAKVKAIAKGESPDGRVLPFGASEGAA